MKIVLAIAPHCDDTDPGSSPDMRKVLSEPLESTASLLTRVRDGDSNAREQLCAQYLPILTRWAHGRLPASARDLAETSDVVQATLIKALAQVETFQPQREGAFLAYLRTALLNAIRSEIRRSASRGKPVDLDNADNAAADSALAQHAGSDLLIDYENALVTLKPEWREAVILRIEFGFSYDELAAAMERPSADAARMLTHRALSALGAQLQPAIV